MLTAPPAELLARLEALVPGGVRARATDRLAMAHDASHYLLAPLAVVVPDNAEQVARLLAASSIAGLDLTFRSGGTSLSGQAGTGHVLVDTRRHFRAIEVLDNGARVRVQPGATVRQVNGRLAPFGRRLGPDPASEAACTVGGVVANNSSGIACGTVENSYQTLESLVLVLPSGTTLDTGAPNADERLRTLEPHLHDGLTRLRRRVLDNTQSVRILRRLFALKNTMGYSLNAFLDHESPAQVLMHLVVGSEGTLAFVAEATFRTVQLRPAAATGLLVFPDLGRANEALPALVEAGLTTVELLDAGALRVAREDPAAPKHLHALRVERHAALLVEHQEADDEALTLRVAGTRPVLASLPISGAELTRDPVARAALWHIRKGLYTAVAGARPPGTTALLEDIAVPLDALARTCEHLVELFERHSYKDSVIFGHAKDGNVHFLLNETFDDVDRYAAFTEDMVNLVLGEGGTLKAEHGTGRIMAPFVRRQYGDELYAVMREVKRLCDPHGVLNQGVLLSDDAEAHLRNLKTALPVEAEVDRCVECGYCEPVCPSKDLTLTPRQRIVLRRERAQAQAVGDNALLEQLDREYTYDGVQTCAADGMCQTACPVLINTGELVKRLRAEQTGPVARRSWHRAAKHWDGLTRLAAAGLTVAKALPDAVPRATTTAARRALGTDRVPLWDKALPAGGRRREALSSSSPTAVLLPSCTGTVFGADGLGATAALLALCQRAGVEVTVPEHVSGLCCGTPWRSKGLLDGYLEMKRRVVDSLLLATHGCRLPVVTDAASCTEGLRELLQEHPNFTVLDAVTFARKTLLPHLPVSSRIESLVLHPTCASTRLGIEEDLTALAESVSNHSEIPDGWGCCGFAGDRGLLHPELSQVATAAEASSVRAIQFDAYASLNRPCEIALSRATGRPYRHILELLEQATRP